MPRFKLYLAVFGIAALYDGIIGFVLFFFYPVIYHALGIPNPTEPAYLQGAAAFVFVQGFMYALVYRNMAGNVDLITVGALYKAVYSAVAFYHWLLGDLPHPMFVIFGFIDLVFLVLFVLCLRDLRAAGRAALAAAYSKG